MIKDKLFKGDNNTNSNEAIKESWHSYTCAGNVVRKERKKGYNNNDKLGQHDLNQIEF